MALIVTRIGKGSPLTNIELDSNFSNLNVDKLEISAFDATADAWFSNKSLNDLSDIVITNPLDGQALIWNGTTNKWENQTVSSGSGLEGGSLEVVVAGLATMDTFNVATYSTVKYLIQATRGASLHTTELILLHDGTDVFTTEYGTVFTSQLFTIQASINSGNINVNVVTSNDNTYIDYKRIAITSRIQVDLLSGDLMLLSGIEDLQTGSGLVDLQV